MKRFFPLIAGLASLVCAAPGRAGLTFAKTEETHTAGHNETEVEQAFKFKVTGGRTVKILDIGTYCSCLKAETKDGRMEFKDGEEGAIETKFLLGAFEGEQVKQVVVTTDDPANREITLTVRMTIPPLYKAEPESLNWAVGEALTPKKMKFTVLGDKEIPVTGLVSSRENMVAELKEVTKGREYEITLTPKTTENPMMGILRVETGAPFPRYQKRLLFFNVSRPKPGAPKA